MAHRGAGWEKRPGVTVSITLAMADAEDAPRRTLDGGAASLAVAKHLQHGEANEAKEDLRDGDEPYVVKTGASSGSQHGSHTASPAKKRDAEPDATLRHPVVEKSAANMPGRLRSAS